MILRGPKALLVFAGPLIAVGPKLAAALIHLLHSLLAEPCGTPREPRTLPFFAVYMASIAVGVLLLLLGFRDDISNAFFPCPSCVAVQNVLLTHHFIFEFRQITLKVGFAVNKNIGKPHNGVRFL